MRPSRPVRRLAACTAVSLAVAGFAMPAAHAVQTPIPAPEDPDQPPASWEPAVPGPIFGQANTGIGVLRVLPGTVPGDSIVDEQLVPNQSVAELGMGLAAAKADSETYLAQERSIAEASPASAAGIGNPLQAPFASVGQTAEPDHSQPSAGGVRTPPSPADALLELGAMQGSAHARWDELQGPCVAPISDATTSVASVSALNALPALPDTPDEAQRLLPGGAGADGARADRLRSAARDGSLGRLGGLLSGGEPDASGRGSLLSVPEAVRAQSRVELVDVPTQTGKAVRSTSTMRFGSVRLLAGTPQELRIDALSEPTVTATSTGDPNTSTAEYSAPVLRVSRGGEQLAVLDAAHPQVDLPIGMPDGPGKLPIVGDALGSRAHDLGVLRLNVGSFAQHAAGGEIRGDARLFELKVLPGDALGMPGAALADISFGEQTARSAAPAGGVHCGGAPTAAAPVEPAGAGPDSTVPVLAETSAAYRTIPLFWGGAGLLLLGAVLVAATPRRQR